MASQTVYTVMALDIGAQRTGVALANSIARIANPLLTLSEPSQLAEDIKRLIAEHDVKAIIVGLPRGLQGQDTPQTAYVRRIVGELEKEITIPLHFIDEAATSVKAEKELEARKKPYAKEDIDMLAATYILEDFLREHPEELHV